MLFRSNPSQGHSYIVDEILQDGVSPGETRQDKTKQDKARQDKARQDKARQGKARQGKARQGKETCDGRKEREKSNGKSGGGGVEVVLARDTPEIH